MKIKQMANHPVMKQVLAKEGSAWVKTFSSNTGLAMMYSLDKTQHGELHHLSISRRDKYPDWDEIVEAKEEIMGDIDAMMILPKRKDYVNAHEHCFHLWETPVEWDVR